MCCLSQRRGDTGTKNDAHIAKRDSCGPGRHREQVRDEREQALELGRHMGTASGGHVPHRGDEEVPVIATEGADEREAQCVSSSSALW